MSIDKSRLVGAAIVPLICYAISSNPAQAQASAAVTASSADNVDEIVVTAQRRAERQQDVPITMTAVSGEALTQAGVSAVSDLAQVVPALRIDKSGGFTQPSVRGVGSALANVGGGSAVGVYIDGFYNPSPLSSDFQLLNVTSVQVLKGPQGTLFGRNTTAGAILITSTEPSQDTQIRGRASYGRFNTLNTAVYATTGLTDNLAVDIAGLYKRSDGFVTNLVYNDDKAGKMNAETVRVGLKYDLGGSSYLLARYTHTRDNDPSAVLVIPPDDLTVAAYRTGGNWGRKRGEIATDVRPSFFYRVHQGTLTGKFDLGFADFSSHSMYRSERSRHRQDADDSSLPIASSRFQNFDRTLTQEFDLSSKAGSPVDWVAGAFYMQQKAGQDYLESPIGTYLYATNIKIDSYALFADATYSPVPRVFVTAGARYSHETDDGYWKGAIFGPPLNAEHPASGKWNNFSPRLTARYQVATNSNVYLSWTKGFKAGLVNVNGFSTAPIAPEKITAYEVGFKHADRRTQFDVSAFYYDYSNLQVSTYTGTQTITTNAAKSKIYGAEVQLSHRFDDHLSISGGAAWTHARYDSYLTAPRFDLNLNPASPGYGTFRIGVNDSSHFHMQRAPTITGNVAVDYSTPLASGTLGLNANVYYTSSYYFDASQQFRQDGYALVNGRIKWTEPGGRWSVGGFVENLTNTNYLAQALPATAAVRAVYAEPRTYGVTLEFNY